MSFVSFYTENITPYLTVPHLSHITPVDPLHLIYTSLIPWPMSNTTRTYTGFTHSTYKILCPFSNVKIVPKDLSKPEAIVKAS